jgi:hypothetical protein
VQAGQQAGNTGKRLRETVSKTTSSFQGAAAQAFFRSIRADFLDPSDPLDGASIGSHRGGDGARQQRFLTPSCDPMLPGKLASRCPDTSARGQPVPLCSPALHHIVKNFYEVFPPEGRPIFC